jgi:hypothetical protein
VRGLEKVEPRDDRATGEVVGTLATFLRELSAIKEVVAEMHQMLLHQTVQKEWYSTTDLAETMNVSVYTVAERWCHAGRIECEKDHDTGKWRIPGREYLRLTKGGGLKSKAK